MLVDPASRTSFLLQCRAALNGCPLQWLANLSVSWQLRSLVWILQLFSSEGKVPGDLTHSVVRKLPKMNWFARAVSASAKRVLLEIPTQFPNENVDQPNGSNDTSQAQSTRT